MVARTCKRYLNRRPLAHDVSIGPYLVVGDLVKRSGGDRHAGRIASSAHALLADSRAARGDADGAKAEWEQAYKAIAPVASGSADYRSLDPLAVSLLNLGRSAEAAPIVQTLAAMGYRDPNFVRNTAFSGHSLPARTRYQGGHRR